MSSVLCALSVGIATYVLIARPRGGIASGWIRVEIRQNDIGPAAPAQRRRFVGMITKVNGGIPFSLWNQKPILLCCLYYCWYSGNWNRCFNVRTFVIVVFIQVRLFQAFGPVKEHVASPRIL